MQRIAKSEPALPRIYFDPNEGPDKIRYALWLPQSLADLERIGREPCDGMRVIIYAADRREVEATLEFDHCCDGWTARPVDCGVKKNDARSPQRLLA